MAHYIGKYNTEDELKIALTNGSLLEPYVAAVGTGSSVSVYYSSDPSPVQPYVCEYYAYTASTISSSGESYTFDITADTPYTIVTMDNVFVIALGSDDTSGGTAVTLTIGENTAETQNHINVRIDYCSDLIGVNLIKSDSFVLTQDGAVSTYLCTATYTTTEDGQEKNIFTQGSTALNALKKIVVDGVEKQPARKQTFETAGIHTVDFYVKEASVSSVSITLFSNSDAETIVMSEDVTTLTGAFCQNASSLTAFTGENITSITYKCFQNTPISTVEMPRLYEAGNQCFAGCTNIGSDIISGLTIIGNNAFSGASFSSAVVNSGVTQIGYSAFQSNTALTSCEISRASSFGSLNDSGLFQGCTSLTGFTYPNEWVISSASTAYPTFKNCSAMTEVTFGTGMTSIGSGMFSVGNTSLVTIKSYAATAPTLGGSDFDSITGNTGTLYVPAGSDYSTWSAALGENWTVSDTL